MTHSTLRTPEVLLSNLNRVGLELLGAINTLGDSTLSDQLAVVLRRLFIADLLAKEWVTAIGGSQGAGKTTLARLLYDLNDDEWLLANEGRGECMPILLLEDDTITAPQGFIRRLVKVTPAAEAGGSTPREYFTPTEVKVSSDDFRKATRGQNAHDLLPVLRLPRQYFTFPGEAFLLLPGYEKQHDENNAWQALMRQALAGASASIVVTDQTRLANAQQREIQKDLQASQLAGTLPIVIIAKCENTFGDTALQQTLRDSAGEVFGIAPALRERFIFCTSTAPEHIKAWQEPLKDALRQITKGSGQARQRQLKQLDNLLREDLTEVLSDIRTKFTIQSGHTDAAGHYQVQEFLETFNQAQDRLKKDYKKKLIQALERHFSEAKESLDKELKASHEGFIDKVKNLLNTPSKDRTQLQKLVAEAWGAHGHFAAQHTVILGAITKDKLGCTAAAPNTQATPVSANTSPQLELLAYADAQGAPVVWQKMDSAALQNLAVIFFPERDDNGMAGQTNKDLTKSIQLLPALALEFGRIASIFPQGLGIDPATMTPSPGTNLTAAAQNVQETFSQLRDIKSDVIKGFAIMLAIDGAADGKIDSIPAILSSLGLGGAATTGGAAAAATTGIGLAVAVTGLVAVGMLTYAIHHEVYRQDAQMWETASAALCNIKERHLAHYLEHFDIMMDRVRETMQERLSVRYRLDESLMRRDRLIKALADTTSFKLDLQEQLSSHSIAFVAPSA